MPQIFNTALPKVAYSFAQHLKIPVTKSGLAKRLKENPFYPSLFSLSDTFDKFRIKNTAFRVEPEDLGKVPVPFIAYLRREGGGDDFVHVKEVKENSVSYYRGDKAITIPRALFMEEFLHIAFVAEPDEFSGEDEFVAKSRKEHRDRTTRMALFGSIIVLLILAYLQSGALWLGLIEMGGLTFSVLLLIYEIDKTNVFVKNICTGGSKTDCGAVLGSKASKLFGITWSEWGFYFFASLSLFTLWPSFPFKEKTPYIALALSGAAFYIPFSIYYQAFVIRQWCRLCLSAQVILAAGFLWSLEHYSMPADFPDVGKILAVSMLLPFIAWRLLKPVLLRAKDSADFDLAYKRLLYNPNIFQGLLQQQSKAAEGWQHLGIRIGRPDAPTTIIKVCNPYCGPCARAHPVLEGLVGKNPAVQVRVIFSVTNNEADRRSAPARHLLAIAARNNEDEIRAALDEWYSTGKADYDAFARKYPMNGELDEQKTSIEEMQKWCFQTGIHFTPTIFINGYRMPEGYDIKELEHIL